MIRSLNDIPSVATSHGAGRKRVLLASNESGCSLTQIAVTDLKAGEVASAHVHPDMQEGFYVMSGELEVNLDGEINHCRPNDFVYVDKCTSHEMKAITDVRIMTIGCVIESQRNKLYPMLFKQNQKTLVWGTEDWVVSSVDGSESIIENGTWARYSLSEVIARRPAEILGKEVARQYDGKMPLLAKIINAHQDLSIQVHPNDEMARRMHGKLGKSEMWYVLDAAPGAHLYAGFKTPVSTEEYKRRVADGTITEVLARHEVHTGDIFYLPSGRVHAICGGIRLAEIQQSSDVTYRIFDYNRLGLDGRPRELHTELAAQAIDYTVYPEYKTEHREEMDSADKCLDTPFFSIRIIEASQPFHRNVIKYDSFFILINLKGDCTVRVRSTNDEVRLSEGESCLIPAAIADYDIIPSSNSTKVLEAFINNRKSLKTLISNFWHQTK